MFKKIATAIILGAATALGSILMNKGFEAASNPVNQAKVKKLFKFKKVNLKDYKDYREIETI